MSLIEKTRSSANQSNPLLKVLMYFLAFTIMPVIEAGKYLSRKAYKGWDGAIRGVLGFGLGIAGGIAASRWVGWENGHSLWLWLPAGILGFSAVIWYAWPLAYLIVGKPVHWVTRKYIDAVDRFGRDHLKNGANGFIEVVKVLKPADKLWGSVQAKEKDSWVTTFVEVIGALTAMAGTVYLGWTFVSFMHGLLADSLGNYVAWVAAAVPAYPIVIGAGFTLWMLLKYGKLAFISVAGAAAATYALAPLTSALVESHGGGLPLVVAACAAEAIIFVAYIFPAFYLVLAGGLIRWLVDQIKALCDTVYDEKKSDWRRFFHQAVNLASVVRFTGLSLTLWGLLGLSPALSIGLAAAVAMLSYILVGKLIDNSAGNVVVSVVASLHAGIYSGLAYYHAGLLFGAGGAIVVAVLTAVLSFTVAFPVVYKLLRAVGNPLLASWLAKPLTWAHDTVWRGFDKVIDQFERVYRAGYRDDSDYRKLFLHLANLGSPVAGYLGSLALAHFLGFGTVLTVATVAAGVALSYLLVGKLLVKVGTELVGSIAGIAAGVWVGALTFAAQPYGLWIAVPLGVLAAAVAYFFAFPALYVIVRFAANPLFTFWLLPLLSGIYEFFWKGFAFFWEQFMNVYRALRDHVFLPFFRTIARIWLSIWRAMKDAWESVFARR